MPRLSNPDQSQAPISSPSKSQGKNAQNSSTMVSPQKEPQIVVKNAEEHNLKGVTVSIPANKLVVFTGVSGSGKSSLAFDTLYIEGQRRYIESLPPQARRQMGELPKPKVGNITGITPTIAIEQKSALRNPRSTVGTMTGIYDYLRVLFARLATLHCPISGQVVSPYSKEQISRSIFESYQGKKVAILFPLFEGQKEDAKSYLDEALKKGFTRVLIDGHFIDLSEAEAENVRQVNKGVWAVCDRLKLSPEDESRVQEAVFSALGQSKQKVGLYDYETSSLHTYCTFGFSEESGLSYPPLEPKDFSFNHPDGMCDACKGLGKSLQFDLSKVLDETCSIADDCCNVGGSFVNANVFGPLQILSKIFDFSVHVPFSELSEEAKSIYFYGLSERKIYDQLLKKKKLRMYSPFSWVGMLTEAMRRYQEAESELYRGKAEALMIDAVCPGCKGSRLKPYPSAARFKGKSIFELSILSIPKFRLFLESVTLDPTEKMIGYELLKELIERCRFLENVGLSYLNLLRESNTLSGGEAQRVRLSSQIGFGLCGATYILDEPSIGLHAIDNEKLIKTLRLLQQRGNTVIVVEHDEEMIISADHIIDLGPGAGIQGGKLVAMGSVQDIMNSPESVTGAYLSRRKIIAVPEERKKGSSFLTLKGANFRNLKNIDVSFPLKVLCAACGVSGSGKSTLLSEVLFPNLQKKIDDPSAPLVHVQEMTGFEEIEKAIEIDQSPIGKTPRSNPATYTKLFDEIRDLYAELPDAKARGFTKSRFSFNRKEGCCVECEGMGLKKLELENNEEVWVTCGNCNGKRFDEATLSIRWKGLSIDDVLNMTIDEGVEKFKNFPSIFRTLELLQHLGLGYLTLGQPSPTLSGGESQRIKLAKELSRPPKQHTLYLLDEPTTGLHFIDIDRLLKILRRLVEKGHTVLLIEHNLDVLKTADYLIELGPEGGEKGGYLIGQGTPEELCLQKTATSSVLEPVLQGKLPKPVAPMPLQSTLNEGIIYLEGGKQNNLKNVQVSLPKNEIHVCIGPSGSGKSSFAFDTLYAEGQRRYIESLPPHIKQHVELCHKPQFDRLEGLLPSIAIEQKLHAGSPRSTVGTMTEIHDLLRSLYAQLAKAYDPETGTPLEKWSLESLLLYLEKNKSSEKLSIIGKKKFQGPWQSLKDDLLQNGIVRLRFQGEEVHLEDDAPKGWDPTKLEVIELFVDRMKTISGNASRIAEAIDRANQWGLRPLILEIGEERIEINLGSYTTLAGAAFPHITPALFSFNTPEGMCPNCLGLGTQSGLTPKARKEFLKKTPEKILSYLENLSGKSFPDSNLWLQILDRLGITTTTPLSVLTAEVLEEFLYGTKRIQMRYHNRLFTWRGLLPGLDLLLKHAEPEVKQALETLVSKIPCHTCHGDRVNIWARHLKMDETSLPDLCRKQIPAIGEFLQNLTLPPLLQEGLADTLSQAIHRLGFLEKIGLDYLSLDRTAPTLSGGETQRIRLSRSLGAGLAGCLYVLEEPSSGLHPYNANLLANSLKDLKNEGNTLLVIEHNPLFFEVADRLIEFGPGAGKKGGKVTFEGSFPNLLTSQSITAEYLRKEKVMPTVSDRRDGQNLECSNACLHNLKNISCSIPKGAFTCITGVSGSGKSSLLDAIAEAMQMTFQRRKVIPSIKTEAIELENCDLFTKFVHLNQNPLGTTSRADVATYSGILTPLRMLFSFLPAAKMKGLQSVNFSYNHFRGMCFHCMGLGYKLVKLQFMPSVKVPCPECHGYKLNPLVLSVKYRDLNLGQILEKPIHEILTMFEHDPKVAKIAQILCDLGLGYLSLNQEISTLSKGEGYRLRFGADLAQKEPSNMLCLFDEPSTGLHLDDLAQLLRVFDDLIQKGATILAVDHHLSLIEKAHYIIDIGPGSASNGGEIVAMGSPEEIAKNPKSKTGQFLQKRS